MTANQIAYQANLETMRANRVREKETNRANRAQEELTKARDFSKEPAFYTLYESANRDTQDKSAVNVAAKQGPGINNRTLQSGLKSIFQKVTKKLGERYM